MSIDIEMRPTVFTRAISSFIDYIDSYIGLADMIFNTKMYIDALYLKMVDVKDKIVLYTEIKRDMVYLDIRSKTAEYFSNGIITDVPTGKFLTYSIGHRTFKLFIKKDMHLRQIIYADALEDDNGINDIVTDVLYETVDRLGNTYSLVPSLVDESVVDTSDERDTPLSSTTSLYKDITRDIIQLLGPYHNFNGQSITPRDLGYKTIRLYYKRDGLIKIYDIDDVLRSSL